MGAVCQIGSGGIYLEATLRAERLALQNNSIYQCTVSDCVRDKREMSVGVDSLGHVHTY